MFQADVETSWTGLKKVLGTACRGEDQRREPRTTIRPLSPPQRRAPLPRQVAGASRRSWARAHRPPSVRVSEHHGAPLPRSLAISVARTPQGPTHAGRTRSRRATGGTGDWPWIPETTRSVDATSRLVDRVEQDGTEGAATQYVAAAGPKIATPADDDSGDHAQLVPAAAPLASDGRENSARNSAPAESRGQRETGPDRERAD